MRAVLNKNCGHRLTASHFFERSSQRRSASQFRYHRFNFMIQLAVFVRSCTSCTGIESRSGSNCRLKSPLIGTPVATYY